MEILNQRAALLSNYEVLTWLRELESEHLLRTKTALRVKKEEETLTTTTTISGSMAPSASTFGPTPHLEASENLRTVEVEAIGYLSANYLSTTSQTEEGVAKLVKNLGPYDFTKGEKLQIVNLMPTQAVELYVIVEELEDRFGQSIEEILEKVKESLSTPPDGEIVKRDGVHNNNAAEQLRTNQFTTVEQEQHWDEDADAVYDEEYFDDTGVIVEGDLEMDDD